MPNSILASLTGLGTDHAVMATAIAAAKIQGGHVTCLHTRIDVVETAALTKTLFPQRTDDLTVMRRISDEESDRSRLARAAFDVSVKEYGLPDQAGPADTSVSASWMETKSFQNEVLDEARFHDMVVMGREPELASERITSVLIGSGRPLLLAPPMPLPAMGKTIAIGWKNGPAAARALTAAGALLRQAQRVFILTVSSGPDGDDRDRHSAERLAKAMSWQGIKAEVRVEHAARSEGRKLQSLAYDCNADLLVTGAYSHGRLREMVWGGITAEMMEGCAIPVLLFR